MIGGTVGIALSLISLSSYLKQSPGAETPGDMDLQDWWIGSLFFIVFFALVGRGIGWLRGKLSGGTRVNQVNEPEPLKTVVENDGGTNIESP